MIALIVRGPTNPPNEAADLTRERAVEQAPAPPHFRCAACGTRLAEAADLLTITGTGPQVYVNPHGRVFELVTFARARNLMGVGHPTPEVTWFPGYAWQIVVCGTCATHVGWAYDALADARPERFFGLIRSALVEHESPDGAR